MDSWINSSRREREERVKGALGQVPVRHGDRVVWVRLEDHWWLFLPRGRYDLGVRPDELVSVGSLPKPLPDVRFVPRHSAEFESDVLLRGLPVLVEEVEVDLERDRLSEDEGQPDILYAHADEVGLAEERFEHGFCSSDEWEAAVRLLGPEVPFLVDGASPSEKMLDDLLPDAREGDLWSWAMPHCCRDRGALVCRGGPGTAWPFQDPSEWLLTVPSIVYACADMGPSVLRPRRSISPGR